ncbi:DUF397 domain-containing protein [Streptomyces sp. NPDC056500]|uniref:DUF397 domain-containing protein n=1 Tax=Streptomyces sp. NPDC056500 TaxID=3345840 RepID=UPI0036C6424B
MIETPSLRWIKSSYSDNGGTCVEWAPSYASANSVVPVRDSKNPTGPSLMVSTSAWSGLITLARTSEL